MKDLTWPDIDSDGGQFITHRDRNRPLQIDIDFSFALNDRTGKLFLGREIIAALGERVARVWHGRFAQMPKGDLARRIAGRLTHDETRVRVFCPTLARALPRISGPRPVLHLDPLSVLRHCLRPRDIVLCHDIGPITHPACFAPGVDRMYALAYDKIRQVGPHMVFVSHISQQAFHGAFGQGFASSSVIHVPLRPGLRAGVRKAVPGVPDRFLLTVGSVGDRKNQARCIAAFARSGLADQGWHYVIAGGREPGFEAVRKAADATPGMILTGYVDDAELRWLYDRAQGFVLMSLLEGFGMPVAEAAQAGLPCLVSDSSVLAEVGGPAMLTADPEDTEAIAEGLRRLATLSRAECQTRIAQARTHMQQFHSAPLLRQWCRLVDEKVTPGPTLT